LLSKGEGKYSIEENETMSDVAVQHGIAGAYEPSLFGTYSKRLGCGCFCSPILLPSERCCLPKLRTNLDSRLAHTVRQGEHHQRNHHDGLPALQFFDHGAGVLAARRGDRSWTRNWILATMFFGAAFIVLHGMEWTNLIHEGMTPFTNPWARMCRNSVALSLLLPHAHVARHHWRHLPGRDCIAEEVPAHPSRYLADRVADYSVQ